MHPLRNNIRGRGNRTLSKDNQPLSQTLYNVSIVRGNIIVGSPMTVELSELWNAKSKSTDLNFCIGVDMGKEDFYDELNNLGSYSETLEKLKSYKL